MAGPGFSQARQTDRFLFGKWSDFGIVREPWSGGFPHMLVGYMRVSSDGDRQTTALQRDALLAAGVDDRHLYEDKASGARTDRPGLARALEFARQGDCLIVWKLHQLGRSMPHLLSIVAGLRERGVQRRCGANTPLQVQRTCRL